MEMPKLQSDGNFIDNSTDTPQFSNRSKLVLIVINVKLKTEAIEQYMALHFKNTFPQNEHENM